MDEYLDKLIKDGPIDGVLVSVSSGTTKVSITYTPRKD